MSTSRSEPLATAPLNSLARRESVLAVATFFPLPADQGDPLRVLMMLKSLNAHASLTVVATRRPDTRPEDVERLRNLLPGARIYVTEPVRGLAQTRPARAIRGVLRGVPPWVLSHTSDGAFGEISRLSPDQDATILLGEAAAQYMPAIRSRRIIWDKANVLSASLRANRRALGARFERLKAVATESPARRFERRALKKVNTVWVTSGEDAIRFKHEYGRDADAVIPSCVDTGDWSPARIDPLAREFFWMSSFRYPPNWDGLVRLLAALSEADQSDSVTLRVAGFGASPSQRATLESNPRVRYMGFVQDPSEAAEGVAGAVVPVWAGAGVKLKTLALAAMSIPLAATPVAMEGIPPHVAATVTDDPLELARRLVNWELQGKPLKEHLDAVAILLEDQFSATSFERRVVSALREAVS